VRAPTVAEGINEGTNRVPGYQVGNLVHRALAEWRFHDLSSANLNDYLLGIAGQVGILEIQGQRYAVNRARHMLDGVMRAPIFQQIQAARQVYREIPFTLPTSQVTLHGTIDLLMRDTEGVWHLVDWKTEWLNPDQRGMQAQDHLSQVAVYAHAAKQTVGVFPQVQICFLAPQVYSHHFQEYELLARWKELESR